MASELIRPERIVVANKMLQLLDRRASFEVGGNGVYVVKGDTKKRCALNAHGMNFTFDSSAMSWGGTMQQAATMMYRWMRGMNRYPAANFVKRFDPQFAADLVALGYDNEPGKVCCVACGKDLAGHSDWRYPADGIESGPMHFYGQCDRVSENKP